MNSPVLTIISFVLIFTVVVVSHEFGHFIIARINGIQVNEFSVGMGPAIFRKKGKSTEFVIRLLPFGGACIFEGETGNYSDVMGEELNKDHERSTEERREEKRQKEERRGMAFNEAPVWGRIASVVAGPLFNIILAYVLALFIVWFCGADLPVLVDVMEGYPAEAAGLKAGDIITEINHHKVHLYREVMIYSYVNVGDEMEIVYERDGEKFETILTPQYSAEAGRYYIGIVGGSEYIECDNLKVFPYSWYEVRYWFVSTIQSLKYMISGHASADDIAGPVGVANIIDDTIEETSSYGAFTVVLNMVNIAVLLSVNLGVVNMLPIPALDGGRLLFLLFEAISGRRVPEEKEGLIHFIGFALLMVLMVFVMFNDIKRFFV